MSRRSDNHRTFFHRAVDRDIHTNSANCTHIKWCWFEAVIETERAYIKSHHSVALFNISADVYIYKGVITFSGVNSYSLSHSSDSLGKLIALI